MNSSLGSDAVEARGVVCPLRVGEIVRAVGETEVLQGSPNGSGEVIRDLYDDGDVGGAGVFVGGLFELEPGD